MLNVAMLSVAMLNVAMLNVAMLNVIMLCVIMLSGVAPFYRSDSYGEKCFLQFGYLSILN